MWNYACFVEVVCLTPLFMSGEKFANSQQLLKDSQNIIYILKIFWIKPLKNPSNEYSNLKNFSNFLSI